MNFVSLITNDADFEVFAVACCAKILGRGVVGFSKGPDGGRDGLFSGTANDFPSAAKPWKTEGSKIVVIQAKHTQKLNLTTGLKDFRDIIEGELPKLKKMVEEGKIGFYLLITNRKETGKPHSTLIDLIHQETGLPYENIAILGREYLDRLISSYPEIIREAGLEHLIEVYAELLTTSHIADVIRKCKLLVALTNSQTQDDNSLLERCDLATKNEKNNASPNFAEIMMRYFDPYIKQIDDVLRNPENSALKEDYKDLVLDTKAKLEALYSDNYINRRLEDLISHFVESEKSHGKDFEKRVRVLVYYMYWNCDIGRKE
ncbi:ABC-three component system protein [Haemophilus haemolyticus]|uniref:ABC-three component system protein n=1 Tax=Haemophilus haemolyticus TaxID=726 RepID=UPI000E585679|nr:ABC-three component system protein [Haemophilus haemolyticus]